MSWELLPDDPQQGGSGNQSGQGRPGGPGDPFGSIRITQPGQSGRRAPRWALVAVGVLVALAGGALLIWPFFAGSQILAILVGIALVSNGIAALVGSRSRGLGVPMGMLLLVLGVLAMLLPELTSQLLVSFVAVMMLIVGVVWLLIALSLRTAIGWVFVALPAVFVALGAAALIWPGVALTIAALATGAITLLIGLSLVWAALALRSRSE